MMGRRTHDQEQFFYSFRLDEAVPDDHPVREVAAVLDLSWVHSELAPYYPRLGRPSIDPVLMIRMLIIGYVFAIRSERALCREVGVNLAYRWFCGLSIEDKIPDHSAFSRARNERFRDSGIFRSVFERVVGACIGAGLVGGEGFAVDASLIAADVNKQRSTPGPRWNKELDAEAVSRATKEYLATLDDAAFGAASDVAPKFVSPSDPAAQWTGAQRGPAFFAYSDNYLIDVKFGIIMDVEASRAIRQAEVGAAKTMIERTEQRFAIKPERLAGDTAYGSGANLDWLVNEAKIAPHISRDKPVTLPPGCERLAMMPLPTGSTAIAKTIGMTAVACLRPATAPPYVTMTLTFCCTNSAAISPMRSGRPFDQRYSIEMFWPALQPSSRSRSTKRAVHGLQLKASSPKYPIVGSLPACSARAATGHTAAPPTSAINSRRLIRSPRRLGRRGSPARLVRSHSRPLDL